MSGGGSDSGSWSREEYLAFLRKEQKRQLDELKGIYPAQHRRVLQEQAAGRTNFRTILPFVGLCLFSIASVFFWLWIWFWDLVLMLLITLKLGLKRKPPDA